MLVGCVCLCLCLCLCVCLLTLYWKRKIPQKRLKRSVVSRERLMEVALLSFITKGMQLYRVYIHKAKAENRSPEKRNRRASFNSNNLNAIDHPFNFVYLRQGKLLITFSFLEKSWDHNTQYLLLHRFIKINNLYWPTSQLHWILATSLRSRITLH